MCGLVGVAGNLFPDHVKAFKQLLFVDQLRGAHSTGIAAVGANNSCSVYKRALAGSDYLQLDAVSKLLHTNQRALIGHNRYATAGSIDDNSAHPFQHGDITLVHNGTLRSRTGLSGSTKFSVDSEDIAHAFSEYEPSSVLPNIDGAYCLVWHDDTNNTLNFARNEERPLTIAIAGDVILWASEVGMLQWICARNKIKVSEYYELPVGTLVTVDISTGKINPKDTEVTTFVPKTRGYQSAGGHQRGTTNQYNSGGLKTSLRSLGYKVGDEVYFYPVSFDEYKSSNNFNKGKGVLRGITWEEGLDVVVYSASATDLELDPATGDIDQSKSQTFTAEARSVTQDYLTGDNDPVLDLESKTLKLVISNSTDKGGEAAAKKPSGNNAISFLIGGKTLTAADARRVCDKGCAWCSNPFSMMELSQSRRVGEEFIHSGLCYDEYCAELVEGGTVQ